MVYASMLRDRAVIAVNGLEARDFLQGLISNDMAACSEGRAIYAALLTPQGKILFDFFVATGAGGGFLLDCASDRASDLLKRLTLYRLRARVEIALRPDLTVAALWNEGSLGEKTGTIMFPDPRLRSLGFRAIGPSGALADIIRGLQAGDYTAHRLKLGVPGSADLPPDEVFALDAGFEELNGVNFKKGCYVGQEVTARMKHRSSARRRFLIADIAGELPAPGTALESNGREIGALATGKAGRALALVRLDRVADAAAKQAPIAAAGRAVSLQKPDWFDG